MLGEERKSLVHARNDVNDAVDGAHSAASKCHRAITSKSLNIEYQDIP